MLDAADGNQRLEPFNVRILMEYFFYYAFIFLHVGNMDDEHEINIPGYVITEG